MQVIADLQLHSKYARAVSPQMMIPYIWLWAKIKGIGLIATGDWTHPLWMREIKANLTEDGSGLLRLKKNEERFDDEGPLFLLESEVSCIYSQGGKGRRVHTLIWSPTIDTCDKINKELTRRGANLLSDGRPIIGLTSIQVAEVVFSIDPKCLIIPAHCLLPDSYLLTYDNRPKPIKDFMNGDLVLTHKGRYQKVQEVLSRDYKGVVFKVKPWYFRPGLTVTPEHPFLAIKTLKKCPSTGDICRPSKSHLKLCKRKTSLSYKRKWIIASELEVGDVLAYPRQTEIVRQKFIQISQTLSGFEKNGEFLLNGGTRGSKIPDKINISDDFGRLIGYYLAEGYTDNRDSISFCFGRNEKEYIDDVKRLVKQVFGLDKCREYLRKNTRSTELIFFSKILSKWFAKMCYFDPKVKKAHTKQIPDFLLFTKYSLQAEIIRGWYRGDKGYTSSRVLMNQFKMLFIRLGILPSVMVDSTLSHKRRGNHMLGSRKIVARYDSFYFSDLSFFDDKFNLKQEIPRSQTKLTRRHGWIDDDYIYLPIKEIEKTDYKGKVYNLEVENDHSYTAEFACVHNCWTPWFSLYGSKSGFDSISDCYGQYAKDIFAVETGLSSDPSMNWRIKELDNRSIVSFSDAHSGPKLGREATVFEMEKLNFDSIRDAITQPSTTNFSGSTVKIDSQTPRHSNISLSQVAISADSKIVDGRLRSTISYTLEFYPEEGKYHYTGHRTCGVKQDPRETGEKGTVCPVCGKPLTIGVLHRVEELAGRSEADLKLITREVQGTKVKGIYSEAFPARPPYIKMVPLQEIIAETIGGAPTAVNVQNEYKKLTDQYGGEFAVLLQTGIPDIAKVAGEKIAQAIHKVREGDIVIDPGYDGVFGVVKIWGEEREKKQADDKKQLSLL